MTPETIIIATGATAIVGGYRKEKHWPSNGVKAILATLGLVVIASASRGSKLEPIIHGIAWLMFLGAIYAAVPAFQKKGKK